MTSPAPRSSTSSHARLTAGTVSIGSMSFSNFAEASVRMPSASAVLRMEAPEEVRGFKDDVDRVGDNFAVLAAHDTGKTDGLRLVGDDEHVGLQIAARCRPAS